MEINITHMINDRESMFSLSGSVMEHGEHAGAITWNASKNYSKKYPLLKSEEIKPARKYLKTFGVWTEYEINSWPDDEVQALITQFVAGGIRELPNFDSLEELKDFLETDENYTTIFFATDNEFYIYLGE